MEKDYIEIPSYNIYGIRLVRNSDNLYNYITEDGDMLSAEWFLYGNTFNQENKYASVKLKDGWHFIDTKGNVLPDTYLYIGNFNDGFVIVKTLSKMFKVLDENLNNVIKADIGFFNIYNFNRISRTFIGRTMEGYCVISENGDVVSDYYEEIREFSSNRTFVRKKYGWNVIDNTGMVQYKMWFSDVPVLVGEDVYRVSINGIRYYVDFDGSCYDSDRQYIMNIG